MRIETTRLTMREMDLTDRPALCRILQDPLCMYAYEGAFSDGEVDAWLENQMRRYREDGHGLWAVILKETGAMIGQCGLTWQDAPGGRVLEVGYLFERAHWGRGYAAEAARACRDYAFDALGAGEVCSIIRDTNVASQNVARRNGMTQRSTFVKHYRGIDMPHALFSIRRDERMDFFEVMEQRHCYRGKYKQEPVPREHLRKIMEAGLAAPSGCNTQTTSIVGVDDPALMAALAAVPDMERFAAAPAAICVLGQDLPGLIAGRWYVQDYAAAIENMLLTITALGYASCWVEGHITLDDNINGAIREVLDIPEQYQLVAFLPVGEPEGEIRPPKKKPFEERAWFNTNPKQ